MSKQEKRGPGRPPVAHKPQTQDIHLNVPTTLIQAIDAVRGRKSRKDIILDAVQEKLEREQNQADGH